MFKHLSFFRTKIAESDVKNRLYLFFCPNRIFLPPEDVELIDVPESHAKFHLDIG